MKHPRILTISGLGLLCILGTMLFAVVRTQPARAASDDQCFSICVYKDAAGNKYVGESAGDCNSACEAANRRCTQAGNGGCQQAKACTSTNCD